MVHTIPGLAEPQGIAYVPSSNLGCCEREGRIGTRIRCVFLLLVVGNIPFALVGGIAALLLRGMNLNLSASVGFIALFGVAMLNGVVLVSAINHARAAGLSTCDAAFAGARRRLRPVLMTAFVASFGFFPMAFSTSRGPEMQRPLVTVVIGGLITSTLLTLMLLPVLYEWIFENEPERMDQTDGQGMANLDHVTHS